MDLSLLGTFRMVTRDDFVSHWTNNFAFQNDDIPVGYVRRTGMATRKESAFVETPSPAAQDVSLINDFADLVARNDVAGRKACAEASLRTQSYLDAIWNFVAIEKLVAL